MMNQPSRRDMLRMMLAMPIAATLDIERLLWLPSPIVTVPALPASIDYAAIMMDAWNAKVGKNPVDTFYNNAHLTFREILAADPRLKS